MGDRSEDQDAIDERGHSQESSSISGRDIVEESSSTPDQDAADAHQAQLQAKLHNGANWFYWIAGLSVVNSAILLADGDRQFIVGLGITQFVDGIALAVAQQSPDAALIAKIAAGVFTIFTAAVFAGFGFGCKRQLSWLFIIGMVLYTFDGLVYLLFENWFLSVGFHIFFSS